MRKLFLGLFFIFMMTGIGLAEESQGDNPFVPINHFITSDLHEENDEMISKGPILVQVSKSKYPKVSTLDSLALIPTKEAKQVEIFLVNAEGKVMKDRSWDLPDGPRWFQIKTDWDISDLEPGVYFFVIMGNNVTAGEYLFEITD